MWHEDRLYLDGELTTATGAKVYANINPATEATLGFAGQRLLS